MMTEGGGCGSFGRAYSMQGTVESLTDQHIGTRHGGHTCNSNTQIEAGGSKFNVFQGQPELYETKKYDGCTPIFLINTNGEILNKILLG